MSASVSLTQPGSSALDEETARAELYGVLSQLYYAPPSPELLPGLLQKATFHGRFGHGHAQDDAAIAAEYDRLFGGVGKPEVFVYASHYLAGFLNEKPLARLRTSLDRLGLARGDTMPETEDHVAYLCEVMRYLIAGDDMAVCNLTAQREFFAEHIQPWLPAMCNALEQHPAASFYAAVARLTRAFAAVEAQGFDMLD